MAVDIKVPSVGESITEGIVSRWLKADGDAVQANEPVFELETDKATTEVVAPAAGVLTSRSRRARKSPSARWSAASTGGRGAGRGRTEKAPPGPGRGQGRFR